MNSRTALSLIAASNLAWICATAHAGSFGTNFENYDLGDVVGDDGWAALVNTPVHGTIVQSPIAAPPGVGGQVLQLNRVGANNGVNNGLNSPVIPGAGESGTLNGGINTQGRNQFTASLWFAAPTAPVVNSSGFASNFLQMNPSTKNSSSDPTTDTASRYGLVSLFNPDNSATGRLQIYSTSVTGNAAPIDLLWGTWYRLEYAVCFCDGLAGTLANDTLTVSVYDATGFLVGTLASYTWETDAEYRNGAFGGGTGPRQVNGFDFISRGSDDGVVGYIDNISYSTQHVDGICAPVPEPSTIALIGVTGLAAASLIVRRRLRSNRG